MSDSDTWSIRRERNKLRIVVDKMRERVKNRVDASTFEGIREDRLTHGLKLSNCTTLIGRFADICFCGDTQEYLVLETGAQMLHRYSMQGKPIEPSYRLTTSTMLFTRMIYCCVANLLAGFIPHDDIIWLFTVFGRLLRVIRNEFRIQDIFYSSSENKIVVVGSRKATSYSLLDIEHPLKSSETLSYLDSSYGALWKIECSSLMERLPRNQLASSYLTTIYVMSLEAQGARENVPVEFLARRISATKSTITALSYLKSCEWIISGDERGNVMGWTVRLESTMSCPNGHDGRIIVISSHPSMCGFITSSVDKVLQVWSCNLREKIESIKDFDEISHISLNEKASILATLGNKICCFRMHRLYVFYATLTASATNLYSTTNPMFPTRVIVLSSDNNVRILSSFSGNQINVQILPKSLGVIGTAYSGLSSKLYTIIRKTGEILVSSTKTNPTKPKDVWINDEYRITCIVVYESYEKVSAIFEDQDDTVNPVTTRIIVGTTSGNLTIIDESSGKHENTVKAHIGSITNLSSSTVSRKIVSVGLDNCVKIWRIFPDIEPSSLALYCSIYYTVPITRIASMGSTICIVGSSDRVKVHRIFMYDSSERTRLDHHPSKDHTATVVDLSCSERLEICASSSKDKTIRIWNNQNELVKILEINTCARCLTFSSLRGDIVFGAGRHLYRISYENYLSPEYRARLMVDEIPEDSDEDEIVIAESTDEMDCADNNNLLHPVSSVPFGSLDTKSADAPGLDIMLLEQLCSTLKYRDEDILQIKEGRSKGTRLVGDKSVQSHEAWEKHIDDLLSSPTKDSEKPNINDFWKNLDKNSLVKKTFNEPGVSRMIYGRSIQSFVEHFCAHEVEKVVKSPKLPLFGFLPNSVIYKNHQEETKHRSLPRAQKKPLKYRYPLDILLADSKDDDSTLSRIAELDVGEISGE